MPLPGNERGPLVVEHGVFRGILLFAAVVLALWAFWLIFQPFLIPIAWALCLAATTAAPYRWLLARWRRPRLAAFLLTLAVFVIVLGPILFATALLLQEAAHVDFGPLIEEVRAQFPDAYERIRGWLQEQEILELPAGREPLAALNDMLRANLPQLARAFVTGPLGKGALSLVGAPFVFLFDFLVALVTLYFVYRESGRLRRLIVDLSPLAAEETDQILESLRSTTSAAILGGVVVALIQGALGGLMFLIVGIASPLLWAVVMAGLSLFPFGGTAFVWVPAAVYLFLSGETGHAVFLLAFGTVIVGAADNLLRPWIFARTGAKDIHPMLLFFAILSGIGLFGISGIVFGPLLLALLTTMLRIYRAHFARPAPAPPAGSPPG